MTNAAMISAAVCVVLGIAVIAVPNQRLSAPHTDDSSQAPSSASVSQRLRTLFSAVTTPVRWAQPPVDIALILTEVSILLRAGQPTTHAWQHACAHAGLGASQQHHDNSSLPEELESLAHMPPPRWLPYITADHGVRWVPPLSAVRDHHATIQAALPAARAACALSATTGAPLAEVLEGVSEGISDLARSHAEREQALAAPQTTARLLAILPFLGVLLTDLAGVQTWEFLIHHPLGHLCLAAGVTFTLTGHALTRRLIAPLNRRDPWDQATLMDLAAAALASGSSIPDCLRAVGKATQYQGLETVGRCLLLGGTWDDAWQAGFGHQRTSWPLLHRALEAGWTNGANPEPLLHAMSRKHRDTRSAIHQRLAQQLSVRLVIPLGLCHLPAFMCLAIIPMLITLSAPLLKAGGI